jgi:gliding motility-associated lipoprotein GldD
MTKLLAIFTTLFVFSACTDDEFYIPKPQANLRIEFPEHTYERFNDDCPYSFELASYMTCERPNTENKCHKDISLGQFNGMIHLSYLKIDTTLAAYINYSIQKVEEHIVKAAAIEDTLILNHDSKVFGTFFEIQGNAASPFQFYYTDSLNHFIRGAVYFNAKPNYDSIYPVLQFVKKDIIQLMNTTVWE